MASIESGLSPGTNSHGPCSVSVIICAFNAEQTVERTLASVLSQTWTGFEVVFVDDGSADRTCEIAERIAQCDRRVRVYRQENRGVSAARNRAIRESTGEWIAPIDADDIWYPENLCRQMRCAQESDAKTGVVYSWSVDIDESDAPLGGVSAASIKGDVFPTLLCHNFLGNGSCTLIRRSAFDEAGGYDESLDHIEDWDLYIRLAERCCYAPVEEFLVGYRQRKTSASHDHDRMARAHTRVIEGARLRDPGVPAWLGRLSQSNLYIYFARRHSEHAETVAAREWLRRAAAVHWLALLRPDWWWLFAFGRLGATAIRSARPPAGSSPPGRRRSFRRLILSALLHRSLGYLVR